MLLTSKSQRFHPQPQTLDDTVKAAKKDACRMMLEWFVVRETSTESDRNASGSTVGRVAATVTLCSTHDSIQRVPSSEMHSHEA